MQTQQVSSHSYQDRRFQMLAVACATFPTLGLEQQVATRLTPLFATAVGAVGTVEAAPLYARVQGVEYVLVALGGGVLVAVEPKTGEVVWRVHAAAS